MISKKNIFSLFFLFALFSLFSFIGNSVVNAETAGDENSRFPFFLDISPDHKDFEAVIYLQSHDMINGYSDNTFKPDNAISRVESVKLLLDASKKTIVSSTSNSSVIFSDIPDNQWFSNYVYTAKKTGVINPNGDGNSGNFNPTRTVNRAEAIKMILEINNVAVESASSSQSWFEPYFQKANSLGLFREKYTNENFDALLSHASDPLTRGEISTYIYKYIQYTNNISKNTSGLSADILGENNKNIPPLKMYGLFKEGLLTLQWSDNENASQKTYTLTATQINKKNQHIQKSIEVKGEETGGSITFDTAFFSDFDIGLITFNLQEESLIRAKFTLPVYTKFTPYVQENFSIHAENTTDQYSFSQRKISAQIDAKNPIDFSKYKAFVLNSSENLYEKPVTSYDENSLYIEFSPKIRDLYIIEITDEYGLAQAVIPVTPYGFFPILPNNLDTLTEKYKNTLSGVNFTDTEIISAINTLRSKHNLPPLTLKGELSSLAQIRARDMKERNYLGHYTPEGLTVNDMRSDYSLTSSLAENLAVHSQGSAFATLGLEYSPTHRMTLLNPDLEFIGVSTIALDNGDMLLVEVFQNKVVTASDKENGKIELYNYINNLFPNTYTDATLQNASDDWVKIMAQKNEAKTEFPDGSNWATTLDTYNINSNTEIFVLSHQNAEKMKEYFEKNPKILQNFFQNKKNYGLSLEISAEGILYLSILGTE